MRTSTQPAPPPAEAAPAAAPLARVPTLPLAPAAFTAALARWYRKSARVLPWRGIRDPYATWLSEIMLQQTRVATVVERYREFLASFPTLQSLAEADESAVLALWSGLGYYRRARMLHRGAQFVLSELGGELPRSVPALRSLPGIGDYTASAIASIAFGEPVAVLDGNVERVLCRILGLPEDRSAKARTHLCDVATSLVPPRSPRPSRRNAPGDHNQAMMELGATLCLPRAPLCLSCPVLSFCKTRGEHPTASRKQAQSRSVAHLLALRKRGVATEVLLERRAASASLMPLMLELPPLPLAAVAGREPVLRLRHGITDTNYYVEIYSESAPGPDPPADPASLPLEGDPDPEDAEGGPLPAPDVCPPSPAAQSGLFPQLDPSPDPPFAAPAPASTDAAASALRDALAPGDTHWFRLSQLYSLPLTGLARKTLQRLRLMPIAGPRRSAP